MLQETTNQHNVQMAGPGRTVRVSGLPADIQSNRLQDKLFIHFLRARNGGGEVNSVVIVKSEPPSALVTFEDSTVAQRVIQRSWHILEVDGKKYKLTATRHQESLDPDQVVLSLSATVDYSQLPGGVEILTNLWNNHKEIQISYAAAETHCTLLGSYSKVHAALAQLLDYSGGPEQVENKDSGQPFPSCSTSVQTSQKPQVWEDQSRKPKQKDKRKNGNSDRALDKENSSSNRNVGPNTEGAMLPSPTAFMEDFTLVVDADMFQYLQEHCKKEYQQILSQNGVEVVNATNQGVTTLFLKAADTAATESGRVHLEQAKKAISRLYEENEAKTCKDQLPKSILCPRGGLQKALENLSVRFPKLLLNEDEQNIYFIGCDKDVSEAKSILLLDHDNVRDKKEDATSPWFNSSQSPSHAEEARVPSTFPSPLAYSDEKTSQMLRSEEEDLRAEGSRRYKLAARFKDSGLGGLGSRPADFTIRSNSSPSRPTHQRPVLGYDVFSEPAGISGGALSRAQNTGGDILFKTGSPSYVAMQSSTSLIDSPSKNSPSSFGNSDFSESTVLPPFGSGSTLRRASSFSGTPKRKAQVVGQMSQDDSSKPTVATRERSSSFGGQTVGGKQEIHVPEVSVSQVMWQYIKEAYSTRLEDLAADVHLEETISQGGRDLKINVTGPDSSKVRLCQERLCKLVQMVSADFSVHEIRLSELRVSSPQDETLQACCTEVRSRFKKVSIYIGAKSLYLTGPHQLCSQVATTLKEVFSGESEPHHFSSPSVPLWSSASSSQIHQSFSPQLNNASQVGLETQTDCQQWTSTYKSDFGEKGIVNGVYSKTPARQEQMTQEKLKVTRMDDRQRAEQSVSLTRNHSVPVNGVSSVAASKDRTIHATHTDSTRQRDAEVLNTSEESGSGQLQHCVCGEKGPSVMRTKCGVTLCQRCLETIHYKCRVCPEPEQRPRGIKGEMKTSRLNISLPGHNKDMTIKITYCIPDGIQGDDDPSPRKPFRGGVFEAYLPFSEKGKRLVPRLKEAFRQGFTFTVRGKGAEAKVDWDRIPHKTSLQGGKAQKGYPDSTYLMHLSTILTSYGIE
nr:uncharacterized protein si:busm1-163l24.3 isoform X1 [Nothobranchius furzeri]XP_015804356.2 uncharacterized protein si:busm1-163l24.3 isoform X1 [Nothobranchius furzeri]